MLFQQRFLDGIRDGSITLAFRRWRRPSVRAGGTLLTPVGELTIASLSQITLSDISERDARQAGYDSLDALHTALGERTDGHIYRIELGALRPDPRIALRAANALTADDARDLAARLKRFDDHASRPWTLRTLELIRARPGVRAGDLCRALNQDKDSFKLNVRKLKALGLTESLEVGYRLSPRGRALLRDISPSSLP
jgi:hypothetical protein